MSSLQKADRSQAHRDSGCGSGESPPLLSKAHRVETTQGFRHSLKLSTLDLSHGKLTADDADSGMNVGQ